MGAFDLQRSLRPAEARQPTGSRKARTSPPGSTAGRSPRHPPRGAGRYVPHAGRSAVEFALDFLARLPPGPTDAC